MRATLTATATAAALLATGCSNADEPQPSASTPTAPATSTSTTPSARATETGRTAATPPAPVRDDRARVSADDQRGDGRTVVVREVRITATPGHVAIFTADRSRLLGTARVPPSSEDSAVTVTLTQPVTGTSRLVAVLFADNGDGGFDPSTDPRVLRDGEPEDDDFTYSRG